MKIISFDEINKMRIQPLQCYEWVEEMLMHKDQSLLPAKTHLNLPDNVFCNVMPSIINYHNTRIGGVKVVTRYPLRTPSLDSKILLLNADTGAFLALLDGNWITAMRTGAVAAHSIATFAKEGYSNLGMIGLGNTARATLIILNAITNNKELHIKLLKYKDQANLFIQRFKACENISFEIVDSPNLVAQDSDVIISCATYFDKDICSDNVFDKGVLVVPVHTRGFTNCDLFFDKVFADDTGHVDHFKNFSKFKYYAEVSDVITGKAKGRENNEERIIAYNIGVSIHDINFAAHICQLIDNDESLLNSLIDVEMHDPQDKFWV